MTDAAADRRALLKNLQMCLKSLLASSEGNSDIVLENSIPLDNYCLGVEAILRYGFRGLYSVNYMDVYLPFFNRVKEETPFWTR